MEQTLEHDCREINKLLTLESKSRVMAALMLQKCRKRVEAGEAGPIGWEAWCKTNIERSYRDVQRLLAIANDPNPDKALERERTKDAAGMRKSRGATVSRPSSGDDEGHYRAAQNAIQKLSPKNQLRLEQWLRELVRSQHKAAA